MNIHHATGLISKNLPSSTRPAQGAHHAQIGVRHHATVPPSVQCAAFLQSLKSAFSKPVAAPSEPVWLPDATPDPTPQFTQWLHERGVSTDKAVVRVCGKEGRGVVARRPIRKGEHVLLVPADLVIDANAAYTSSSLHPVLKSMPSGSGLSEWDMIAVFLAEMRHHWVVQGSPASSPASTNSSDQPSATAAVAAAAKWAPYLHILPVSPGSVLEWSEKQVQQRLGQTPMAKRARALRQGAQAAWSEIKPLVDRAVQEGHLAPGVITEKNVTWALGIMLSRLVQLNPREACGLVPWGDMLNHCPSACTHMEWTETAVSGLGAGTGGVEVIADRDYKLGQQIYISYGQRTSSDLLLSYGFAPEDNPHDGATVAVGLRDDDPLRAPKLALLQEHGLSPQCDFPIRADSLPQGFMPWAAFCAPASSLPPEWRDAQKLMATLLPGRRRVERNPDPPPHTPYSSLTHMEESYLAVVAAVQPPGAAPGTEPRLPAELEAAAWRELASVCTHALKDYASVAAGSANTTKDTPPASTPSSDPLLSQCTAIIAREKQILARTQYVAAQKARELSRRR